VKSKGISIAEILERWTSLFLEIAFPGNCLLCSRSLIFDSDRIVPLCLSCRHSIKSIEERIGDNERCRRCSKPLISEEHLCMKCRTREFAFLSNYSIFEYKSIRELLYLYKKKGNRRLASFFAERTAKAYKRKYASLPLIPVPTRKSEKRRRGWGHTEEIVKILHKKFGITVLTPLSRKEARAQKELGYEERLNNIKGKIVFSPVIKELPEKVILFDDVFTTGATVNECTRVLLEYGIKEISVLTLAMD